MVLFTCAVLLVILFCLWKWMKPGSLSHLPGPKGSFIVGNAMQLDMSSSFVTISQWAKQYGPVYKFSIFGQHTVVITGKKALLEAFITRGEDFAGKPYSYRLHMISNGEDLVFQNYNDNVKWLRKFTHKHLHQYGSGIKRIESITLEEIENFIANLTEQLDVPIDPVVDIHETLRAIIHVLIYSEKADRDSKIFREASLADRKGTEAIGATGVGVLLDIFPFLRFFGNQTYKTLTWCNNAMKNAYLDAKDKYEKGTLDGMAKAMFDAMNDPNTPIDFTPNAVQSLLMNLMGAGALTTGSALSSFFNIMAHTPDVQKAIQTEVEKVVGSGRSVVLDDQENMPYSRACVYELLRYVTPSPFGVPRVTLTNTQANGFAIPKDTQVFLNLWGQNHDVDVWQDPFEFRPDRFLDAHGALLGADHPLRASMFVFGEGPRACVGNNIGLTRIFLFITNLMQRFTILPASSVDEQPSCHPHNMVFGSVIYPKPYQVRFVQKDTI